jgi:hypothetical protein
MARLVPKAPKRGPNTIANLSKAEEVFARAWARSPVPEHPMVRELKFHEERRWRADFAWPSAMLMLEIDGRGRHDSVGGQRKDFEKNNEAVRLGWRVLHVQAMQVKQVAAWVAMVKEMLR